MSDDRAFMQPRFRSAAALEKKIEAYFRRCEGEPLTDEATGSPMLDSRGRPVIIGAHPPTLTGLALALGFPTRAAMLNYRGKPALEALLQQARSRVEQYAEERLYDREGSAGARFSLQRQDAEAPKDEGKPAGYDNILSEVRRITDDIDAQKGE